VRCLAIASALLVAANASAEPDPADGAAEPALAEEVIEVTGRAPTPTQPITVLRREDVERATASTAADALGRIAGVHTDGPHNARDRAVHVRIRGLDARYTLALIDGERMPARDVHGVADLSALPAAAIERIEIVKGPMAVLLGGDAIAGVVNVVTRREVEGTRVDAFAGYGSFATRTGAARLAVGGEDASAQVVVQHERSDGWSDEWDLDRDLRQITAKVDARATDKTTIAASQLVRRGDDELRGSQRLFLGGSHKHKQMTRYVEAGTIEGGEDALDLDGTLAWTRRDDRGGRWAATAHVARHATDKDEVRDVMLRQNGRDVGSLFTDERDDITHWIGSARLQRRVVRGRHELTGLAEWRSELREVDNQSLRVTRDPGGNVTGDASFRDPAHIYSAREGVASVVVQDDWNAGGRVAIAPGVRLDHHGEWGTRICPATSIAARVDSYLTVRYAVGLGYKAPSIESRNRSPVPDLDVNGSRWLAGNPDLGPESSLGHELGAIFEPALGGSAAPRLVISTALFRNDFRDKIEKEIVDDYNQSGLPLEREINIGRAVTHGLEATMAVEVGRDLWLGANYTYLWTRNLDSQARLDRTIAHTGNVQASYTLRPTRTTMRVASRWVGRAVRVSADGTARPAIPALATTDVRIEQPITRHLTLSAQVENLFGATWDKDDDGDTDQPPASLFVGLWAHL
jgi:outer membrane receptor for ferrienterochelin and colicins